MTSLEEYFDEIDFNSGAPLGRQVLRNEAHRRGAAHWALHLWVFARRPQGPVILFQKRALHKQTFPGLFDTTVGGHLRAGETWVDALRESEEEIGLAVQPVQCVEVLRRPFEVRFPGIIDREWLYEMITRTTQALNAFRFDDGEVSAMAEVSLDHFEDLLDGHLQAAKALVFDGHTVREEMVPRGAWNPSHFESGASVMKQILASGRALLGGSPV